MYMPGSGSPGFFYLRMPVAIFLIFRYNKYKNIGGYTTEMRNSDA